MLTAQEVPYFAELDYRITGFIRDHGFAPNLIGDLWRDYFGYRRAVTFRDLGTQLSLFAEYATVNVLPTLSEPVALGAAPTYCDECGEITNLVPLSNPEHGWICENAHECSCCYESSHYSCEHCSKIDACCSCPMCEQCGETVRRICDLCELCSKHCDCKTCDRCGTKCVDWESLAEHNADYHASSDDGCDCRYCTTGSSSSSRGIIPGWVSRGDRFSTDTSRSVKSEIRNLISENEIDPVALMAEFYVCDWVTAHEHGSSSETAIFIGMARDRQNEIVRLLDPVFRLYSFAAIGGEVRHHPSVCDIGGSRTYAWDQWFAMSETIGTAQLTSDAIALFADYRSWDTGFGGSAWESCARVLAARETGSIDPRTFVDRCFSLQHNGGSFLNKVSWHTANRADWQVQKCVTIGAAHAARETNLSLLLALCSGEVRDIFGRFWTAQNRNRRDQGLSLLVAPRTATITRDRWDYVTVTDESGTAH